jgi:hypothetical protein
MIHFSRGLLWLAKAFPYLCILAVVAAGCVLLVIGAIIGATQ